MRTHEWREQKGRRTTFATAPNPGFGVFLAICLLVAAQAVAQNNGVVTTFFGTPEDVFYDVTATSDGGAVAAGYTTRGGAGGRNILLVKVDACGDQVWAKTLGGSNNEEARSIIELPGTNGDLALVGQTNSVEGSSEDHLLVSRLNSLGQEVWTRVLADNVGSRNLHGYDLICDSTGDLVITGTVWNALAQYSVLLAKFATDGTYLMAKAYRLTGDDWGESITEACVGRYVVVGGSKNDGHGNRMLIASVQPGLGLDWNRFYGSPADPNTVGHGVAKTDDNKIMLTGESAGHFVISKHECTGARITGCQKKLSGATSVGHNIIATSGNGLVAVGGYDLNGTQGAHVLLGSWATDCSVTWRRAWGQGVAYGVTEDIQQRLWVAGPTGTAGADALLAKPNSNGHGCFMAEIALPVMVDWNPDEDVTALIEEGLPLLTSALWNVDSHDVSLQQEFPCDDECLEACCLADGVCQDLTPRNCTFQGGQPEGANTSCLLPPTLLSPADQAACLPLSGVLDWSDVAGATGYRVQIGTICGSGNEHDVTISQYTYSNLLPWTTYYWRVKGKDSPGCYGDYSNCFSFTTDVGVPPPPELLSPSNGAMDQPCWMTLDWSAVPGATAYHIQIGTSCGSGDEWDIPTSACTYNCQPSTTYYWRVKVYACGTWSEYSGCHSFTTMPPIPAVSEWGLAIMAMLLLTAGLLVFHQRSRHRVATRPPA